MERFDCIIVGCGIAGCSAGYVLAEKGLKVLILERGGEPGEKNVMGGVLYVEELKKLGIDISDLPRERKVVIEGFIFPSQDECSFVERMGTEEEGYTVFRSKFDVWFARKVEEKGAVVVKGVKVKAVKKAGDEWIVHTEAGEASAPFVVGADGVNSTVAKVTGLRKQFNPEHYILTAKEVIYLSPQKIEERFNLVKDEGVILDIVGIPYIEVGGGGFLYTNRETVSIGAGARLSSILRGRGRLAEYIEYVKKNPGIRKLIEGGELVEYSAHMIPFGAIKTWKDIIGDGVVLVGDAMGSILPDLTGAPFAVFTGKLAAETIVQAWKRGNNSAKALSGYYVNLKREGVWSKLRRAGRISWFLKKFPSFLSGLSYGVNSALYNADDVYGLTPFRFVVKLLMSAFKDKRTPQIVDFGIDSLLEAKIGTVSYRETSERFIEIDEEKCRRCSEQTCIKVCPAGVYRKVEGGIYLQLERCFECGACRIICKEVKWNYPSGGRGVIFRYG